MKPEFILPQPGPGTQHRAQPAPCPSPFGAPGRGGCRGPCSFLQVPGAAVIDHRLAEGKCAVQSCPDFCCCVFSRCFYREGPRNARISPCEVLGRLRAAALEGFEGVVGCSVAFFSYESGNSVINSSVTSNHVLVSNALTGANLNVFHLKSKPKKSLGRVATEPGSSSHQQDIY